MKVTVLIPTYKEYENLKKLIPHLYADIYPRLPKVTFQTLIVDDNSPDGTKKLISTFQRKYKNLFVSYGKKRGIGAAMKRGYLFSLKSLKPDYVATLEADYVVEPKALIDMIKLLSKYDIVLASRANEEEYYGKFTLRRAMHLFVNTFICNIIGGSSRVHEHTAACRIVKVQGILTQIDFNSLPNGYSFFPSILFNILKTSSKITEYKVNFQERNVGTSKMNIKIKPMVIETADIFKNALKARLSSL